MSAIVTGRCKVPNTFTDSMQFANVKRQWWHQEPVGPRPRDVCCLASTFCVASWRVCDLPNTAPRVAKLVTDSRSHVPHSLLIRFRPLSRIRLDSRRNSNENDPNRESVEPGSRKHQTSIKPKSLQKKRYFIETLFCYCTSEHQPG